MKTGTDNWWKCKAWILTPDNDEICSMQPCEFPDQGCAPCPPDSRVIISCSIPNGIDLTIIHPLNRIRLTRNGMRVLGEKLLELCKQKDTP